MKTYTTLAISDARELVFGTSPHPVQITRDIVLGAGRTFPEINYILPYNSEVSENTLPDVVSLYRTMAQGVLQRALDLEIPALVIEIELVFELTLNPGWGEAVIRATREAIDEYESRGVHAALRTTIADIRDRVRPPRNRTSRETELVFTAFERCAPYSDILSIESTGGKEVCDDAILQCNAGAMVFALGVLASHDMQFLWQHIVDVCERHEKIAGGDAACGFANTAMQLARKRMTPTVFAAVVRAVGAARSLIAIECGATGPDKDCAYEGPILKAISGIPISMEGKSAACAHSSPLGNVAMCCCDLWSNESTPYVQLFGGYSPEVMLEQLWYDCKLMNQATASGNALVLRDMLSESDIHTSAEALMLAPSSCIRLAKSIVRSTDYAERAFNAAAEALQIMDDALSTGSLTIPDRERPWLDMIKCSLDEYHSLGDSRTQHYSSLYRDKFISMEYGLGV